MPLFVMEAGLSQTLPPGCYYQSIRENTFREVDTWAAPDGTPLKIIHHFSTESTLRLAYLYLHGIESHAAWFAEAADNLCSRGTDVYCMDRRGSGLNQTVHGLDAGDVDSADSFLRDLDTYIQHLRKRYSKIVVIGLSWGAKLAMAQSLLCRNKPDGIVLVTPGLIAQVTFPFPKKLNIFLHSLFRPATQFPIPIKPHMFTDNDFYLEKMRVDPLRLQSVSARFYAQTLKLDSHIRHHIAANQIPILCFFAGRDQIINNAATESLLQQGAAPGLETHTYADQIHSIQFDAPQQLADDINHWVSKQGFLS